MFLRPGRRARGGGQLSAQELNWARAARPPIWVLRHLDHSELDAGLAGGGDVAFNRSGTFNAPAC
jgi:hypothetical protein